MRTDSKDKIYTIFQVIVFVIVILIAFYHYSLPGLKNAFGSSDTFINDKECSLIVEIELSSGPDFILIINTDKLIANILFLNDQSTCLYNKNIENHSVKDSIKKITKELYNNGYLKENITIRIIEYPLNDDYSSIVKEFTNQTDNFNVTIQESKTTLSNKIAELSLVLEKDSELKTIENYSKKIISNYKDQLLITEYEKDQAMTNIIASNYANNVYEKLAEYASNILNQDITDTNLPIQLIPANEEMNIYPTKNSWYYINEHKVYAYIEFESSDNTYSYCYNGEISGRKEGKCNEEFSEN